MEALALLLLAGMVFYILTFNFGEETIPPKQPEPARVMPSTFEKVVEATEEARELPDGTVLTVRKVRQWH